VLPAPVPAPPAGAEGLLGAWSRTCAAAGAHAPQPDVEAAGIDLLHRWAQPHRRYHDLRHLREVLDAVDALASGAADADAVRLAAWFHDAVYDGAPGEDERRSAALAGTTLAALAAPPALAREVARLVDLTAAHDPAAGDVDGAVLCDADLAILGSPPQRYDEYAADVRAEYAAVPDDRFSAARSAVLGRLLARPRLYRTMTARALWEQAARANLARELGGGASGG
jgi:predicted metal-dependent HD superfamily phosphohydrolase